MIIQFPKCKICNRVHCDLWKCIGCLEYVCKDCTSAIDENGQCYHRMYTEVVSDFWELD